MELAQYIRLLRKWLWLIILAAFLGGGVAFLVRSGQPPTYRAEAMISVGSYIDRPNPSTGEISLGEELAQTYAVLAKTHNVLQAAVDAGNFPTPPDTLRELMDIRIVPDTSLLIIGVTYTDPILATDMANAIAEQLIRNSPSNLTPDQQSAVDLANSEIEALYAQLRDMRRQLQTIDEQLENETDEPKIEQLSVQRNALVQQINQTSSNIAQFSSTVAEYQQRSNSLDIVERARVPTRSSGPSPLNTALLGAVVGGVLAVGVTILVEYLDDTLKTPEEATQALGLPVLGTIFRFGKADESYADRLITQADPSSPIAESYRALRTNLLFSTNHVIKRAYIVTSPGPEEGKTVTVTNLAVVMAASGLRVLLIDADLRRPKIHQVFGLENRLGLTTLLSAHPANASMTGEDNDDFRRCLQDTAIPGLRVITSGFIPSNPTEVLGSALMQRWFQVFLSSQNVDVVLFDTPPALFMADSVVLAATISVPVVMVIEAGRTRRSAAQKAKEQFTQLNVDVRGVVLNQVKPVEHGYGYGYGNYYYYYYSPELNPPATRGGWRQLFTRNGHTEESKQTQEDVR